MTADDVRAVWADRTAAYSPRYYAHHGPDERSELVRRTLDRLVDPGDPVLEVGCSSGRHLAHLHEHGYTDLHGIDVNDDALEVMAESYPALAEAGTFHHATIGEVVTGYDDDQFGAVFSVETLQHVPDDAAWVFAELARVTGGALLTVECERLAEGDDGAAVSCIDGDIELYHRRWDRVFEALDMEAVEARPAGRDRLRAFRPA